VICQLNTYIYYDLSQLNQLEASIFPMVPFQVCELHVRDANLIPERSVLCYVGVRVKYCEVLMDGRSMKVTDYYIYIRVYMFVMMCCNWIDGCSIS
jgi:hypothetical protein